MTPLVFIDGDQGTTGLQVRQWLAGQTDLRVLQLPPQHRKSATHRAEALNDCDIALLCLPDDAAREAVALVRRPGVRVIDASSAHRTAPGWVYGLPELEAAQPGRIASAARVSNPGCYPTGAVALLRPLLDAGLLPPDYPLAIHAVSGYSGRGRAAWRTTKAAALPTPRRSRSTAWACSTSTCPRSSSTRAWRMRRCSYRPMATTARASC
jgi:N-acetyl-gamma-glutamyl-phosphate reductase